MALSISSSLAATIALIKERLFGQPTSSSQTLRPTVELWPERLSGDQVLVHLKVSNPTQDRMRITRISVERNSFEVWDNFSAEAASRARRGKELSFMLEPGQSKLLPVRATKKRDAPIGHGDKILVHWLSPRPFRRVPPPIELVLTHEAFWALRDV